jgi:O-antigen/teichoic acid export membrane protein
MSFLNKLIKQSSTYMVGEILIMIGGFISFPIFTRMLTKQEYGVMNLISISMSLVEEFSTLGIRHAVTRFYTSYESNDKLPVFYSTTTLSSLVFGIIGTFLTAIICMLLSLFGFLDNSMFSLLLIASLLIVTRVMTKVFGTLFRMQQMVKTYTVFAILSKYLGMGISIVLVSAYLYGIKGFFLGLVVGEIVSLILIYKVMLNKFGFPTISQYSSSMLKGMVTYGFPLIFAGFANSLLTIGDRYLIGSFLSAEDVAIYSVPYNLCSYILSIFVTGFEFAYFPLILNEWKGGESENARQGIVKVVRLYCMCALPVIFGVSALGEKIITIVASNKYVEASYILPYVILGEMIMGISTPLMMGFVLLQKTGTILKYKWYAVVVNFSLNLALIPIMGLKGAAVATLSSYTFFVVVGTRESFNYFRIPLPYFAILNYSICSVIMFTIIKGMNAISPGLDLIILIFAGFLSYLVLLCFCDRDVRRLTFWGMQRMAVKLHG